MDQQSVISIVICLVSALVYFGVDVERKSRKQRQHDQFVAQWRIVEAQQSREIHEAVKQ